MKASITKWSQEDRSKLVDVLPVESPLSVQIEVSSACNFKCSYCFRQFSPERYTNNTMLDLNTFKKFINDSKGFKAPIKSMVFARIGEPTLNPYVPEMIAYAKECNVVKATKIITNGSMLSPEYNLKLINAGLDVLRISIQGLTEEDYIKVCDYKMDMNVFIKNIKHFYDNRGNCKVFIKTVDSVIEGRENLFYDMFGDICDEISIEHTIPNYGQQVEENEVKMNMLGESVQGQVMACAIPFYALYIASNGDIEICNIEEVNKLGIGNLKTDNVTEIWHGEKLNEFRRMQLRGERFNHFACKKCTSPTLCLQSVDNIDAKREELLEYYK